MEDSAKPLKTLKVVPLYRQLMELIEEEIISGRWKRGSRIPSEAELIRKYAVSRITVRAAINELVEAGLLKKMQGKGTFVINRKCKNKLLVNVQSFDELCRQNNMKPRRKLLEMRLADANEDDIRILKLQPGVKVVEISRVLLADGDPLILSRDRVHEKFLFLLREDLEEQSLNRLMMEKGGVRMLRSLDRTIEVRQSTTREAELLHMEPGDPLLLVRDVAGGEDGTPVRRTEELIVGDHVVLTYGMCDYL